MTITGNSSVDLAHYSAALDEIYRLRAAFAEEAAALEVYLSYATIPKRVRQMIGIQIGQMRAAAGGEAGKAYAHLDSLRAQELLRGVGVSPTLTRSEWEGR